MSIDSILNINIDVTRNTKNFDVDETCLITNKNENAKNKFEINVIEKKTRFIVIDNWNQKRFDREIIDLKNKTLSKFNYRNLKLTKFFCNQRYFRWIVELFVVAQHN